MSQRRRFPDGLANSSGLVGKYLMFNGYCTAGGTFERRLNDWKSVADSRMVHDFYDTDPARGFYGGGGIDARFAAYPIGFALGGLVGGLAPDAPTWGPERSEEHTSELQSQSNLVCRLLLEKKKK